MIMKWIKGFSMIEMIVTMVIISILTVIAAPDVKSVIQQEHLNQSASDLIRVLNKAQSRALFDKKVIQVYIASDPSLTETTLSWMPSGDAYFLGVSGSIYIGARGYMQTSATNTAFAGAKSYVICSKGGAHSRKITYNRIGVITDSGIREGCNAD